MEQVDFLKDINRDGKERPWKQKKEQSLKMAEAYQEAGLHRKATRMCQCGEVLEFKRTDNGLKLANAYFCKVRLCPMCMWRRSLKLVNQNTRIIERANEKQKLRWVFLTLTVKNVEGEDLKSTLAHLSTSFRRMFGKQKGSPQKISEAVVGYLRTLEITRDTDRLVTEKRYKNNPRYYKSRGLKVGDVNPNFNTYHPHYHVLICTESSYFGKKYINQKEWTSYWQKCARLDYTPIVDVRPVKPKKQSERQSVFATVHEIENSISEMGAVLETSKYAVKDMDVITNFEDIEESAGIVKILDDALLYKRLIGYGGLLKEIKKELELEDIEDDNADLIQLDDSADDVAQECQHVMAYWHTGHSNYVLSKKLK
ncbi:protein rep [Bacillus wiedmannii]|uniref:protein rep n=1 Tax=Bacillus wiedmannii TaxID=1890302 RepID=UPI003CF0A3F6